MGAISKPVPLLLLLFASPVEGQQLPVAVGECLAALGKTPRARLPKHHTLSLPRGSRPASPLLDNADGSLAIDCGEGTQARIRCQTHCLGLCFLQGRFAVEPSQTLIAVAGQFSPEGGGIWLLERAGSAFRTTARVPLDADEAVLLRLAEGRHFADVQGHVLGIGSDRVDLSPTEREVFYVLGWKSEEEEWIGSLAIVTVDAKEGGYRMHHLFDFEGSDN